MLRLRFGGSLGLLLGLAAVGCGNDAVDPTPDVPFNTTPQTQVDAAVVAGDAGQQSGTGLEAGPSVTADGATPLPEASTGTDAMTTREAGSDASAAAGGDASADAGPVADAGSDTSTGGGALTPKPKCVKKDSQVLVVGDSFINWISHDFPNQLKTATKQNWRMLAIGGTAMGSGGIGRIPDQFDEAIKADPDAHTVLMDGGGNDVLVADLGLDAFGACKDTGSSTNPNCNMIIKLALDAANAMMDRAAAAGIRDVVYFFYPHIPEGRLIGGPHPNEILDHSLPMVKALCDGAEARTKGKLRCHFIDMIPVFVGHIPDVGGLKAGDDADWFNDDIHPNPKGSQAMVDRVWKEMTDKCIGQVDKDCCEK